MDRKGPRFPTLDLLRLVAISMTMLAHTPNLVQRVPLLRETQNSLWLGVDLFMLISGWLLGGQLLREDSEGGLRPARFYLKRWMRTLPPYYAMLAILYYLPGAPEFHRPQPLGVIISHFTFTQVYAGHNDYMVSWSLCVEEHFYLLLPLVIVALRRVRRIEFAMAGVFLLEAISVACRLIDYDVRETVPFATHLRCHGLFLGLLFAFTYLRHPATWRRIEPYLHLLGGMGVAGTLLVLASVPPAPSRWMFIGAPTIGTWTFAMLFLPCVHAGSRWSRFTFRGLTYLGGLTYSIYLTHSVIPRDLVNIGGGAGSLRGIAWRLLLTAATALALHHVIERPALWLRDRLLSEKKQGQTG